MTKRLQLAIAFTCLLLYGLAPAQTPEEQRIRRAARGRDVVGQDELVSFRSDVPYKQALELLNDMAKKFLKKPIIDPSPLTTAISVNIESMYWRDALELILRTNGMWYNELPDYIQVTGIGSGGGPVIPGAPSLARVDSGAILAKTREITISAIFLEIDKGKLNESGISFSIFRGGNLNLGVEFTGADRVASNIFGVTVNPTDPRLAVDVTAALRIFESEQIGEIIARPQVTVRSGVLGRVQIGADFSVKERDFSGNVIDRFYSTGTILEVTPRVYMYGATPLIDLDFRVERSNVQPGAVSTIINKTDAKTRLVLMDGEESYVAGLVISEETATREGIPLLKDLPWWVFGLRYVFG
ncbi:MAG: hypothetical protein WEE20_15110, partial [Bacteroidota bacterium]